ncbi:MAG TPA: acetylxylan esterase [Caldilineaceae bacterium]|nr:acetylxylan esterase [Caldilineaceae bacterium]
MTCPELQSTWASTFAVGADDPGAIDRRVAASTACAARLRGAGVQLEGYAMSEGADGIRDLVAALRLGRVSVAAGGFTTTAAVAWARANPGSVASLLFTNPTPPGESVLEDPAAALSRSFRRIIALCRDDAACAAAYPGLLTSGIDDPQRYVYRGILADCCRVIDFLHTRDEVDRQRIALVGDDLALMTAALRPTVDALYCAPAVFYAPAQYAPLTGGYPLEEINDYVRTFPEKAEQVGRTLAYYDLLHFAPRVQAATLLVTGNARDFYSLARLAPLSAALGEQATVYETTHSSYQDGVHQEGWLRTRYGYSEPLLPPHWR